MAGRLARVTQQALEQEVELEELRLSLHAERAALKALRPVSQKGDEFCMNSA